MGGLQQKSSHKRLIFNCALFNLLFSSHFTSIPTHFSLLCPHTQPRSKCKIRKMEINPSSRVIPYKKNKKQQENCRFLYFLFFFSKDINRKNRLDGTNLITKGKAQQIVGQSLLSCLHHLGIFKSSANDLSLPIFEIAIAP